MTRHFFAEKPSVPFGGEWDAADFASMLRTVEEHGDEIAAVICEPVFQAANAMNFYHPQYLRELRRLCDKKGILLIFDEIAAGFHRTGPRWAQEHAGVSPDIMTVGKKGRVYAATDDMIFSCFELGASGAISAIVSVFPEECVRMWKYAKEGNHGEGLKIQNSLYEKWQCLGGNQFPIRLKYALKCLGRDCGECRSPITYLPQEEKERIRLISNSIITMQ
jgi:hypothetical protein